MRSVKMEKRRVTIYFHSEFGLGIRKIECSAFGHEIAPCAQWPSAVHYSFVKKGARNPCGNVETFRPSLLVLDGWGHPDPDGAFVPAESSTPGVEVQRGRYRSCDPRWQGDFDAMIAAYLEATGAKVVADFRKHDASGKAG